MQDPPRRRPAGSTPGATPAVWTRRQVLVAGAIGLGGLVWPERGARAAEDFTLPDRTREALRESPYVYVSPLHRDGSESSCHGEVWYFVDDGDVVLYTARDRWKARAIRTGRDRARIWVGDYGTWQTPLQRFREGPSFVARAGFEERPEVFERLMEAYARRYPEEWDSWRPRFRKGWEEKTRVMIRYTPVSG